MIIKSNYSSNSVVLKFVIYTVIIEVRAADISHPDYIRCPNINKYIDLIKSTQGNWVFKNTNTKDELHLFVFSMLIY